jgi:hypothetical protein
MDRIFSQTIFGSQLADSLAAIGFVLFLVALTKCSVLLRAICLLIFAVAVVGFVANASQLTYVGFATLPIVLALITLSAARRRKTSEGFLASVSDFPRKTVALVYLVMVIIVEIGALVRWIAYPLVATEIYSEPSWKFASLESSLFQAFDLLSPPLFVLGAFSFVYRWYIISALKRIFQLNKESSKTREAPSTIRDRPNQPKQPFRRGEKEQPRALHQNLGSSPSLTTFAATKSASARKVHIMLLSVGLIAAPSLMIYPHLPSINLTGNGISTDERYYLGWAASLRSLSDGTWSDTILKSFEVNNGDRPLSLLLIVLISNLTQLPDLTVIRYLPVALAPLIVATSYLLVSRTLRSDDRSRIRNYAALCAVFAAFSIQAVVGQYAGLIANWMALVVSYFALYFLIKVWEADTRRKVLYLAGICFAILMVIMLLHLYTWAHILTVAVVFAAASYVLGRRSVTGPKFKALLIILVVGCAFGVDYAKSLYFHTPVVGAAGSVIVRNVQPEGATDSTRWEQLHFILQTYIGGFLSNPALFLLALIWIVKADLNGGLNRMMFSMICIAAVPFAFGNAEFETRVLYNIPYHIPAVLALFSARIQDRTLRYMLIFAITLFLATYAIRAMANLYLVLPEGYTIDRPFLLP